VGQGWGLGWGDIYNRFSSSTEKGPNLYIFYMVKLDTRARSFYKFLILRLPSSKTSILQPKLSSHLSLQPPLPLHPQPLHLGPALPAHLLEPHLVLRRRIHDIPPAAPRAENAHIAHAPAVTPSFNFRPPDSFFSTDRGGRAPFAGAVGVFEEGEVGGRGKGEPDGSAGAFVGADGVPGGAEPAGEVEGEEFEVDEEGVHGDDVGGCDARVADIEAGQWGYCRLRVCRGGREEAIDIGSAGWEGGGQGEDVGKAFGAVVGGSPRETLDVSEVEGGGVCAEGAEAYEASRGREQGDESVSEEVVAEDVGAEDLAQGGFLPSLVCVAAAGFRRWELRFGGDAEAVDIEGGVGDRVDEVDGCQPEGLRPFDTDVVGDARVEDEDIEFWNRGSEALGDIVDGEEDGEIDLFSLEGDSLLGLLSVAIEGFSQARHGVIALLDGPGGDDEPEGFRRGSQLEELVDETTADCKADAAGGGSVLIREVDRFWSGQCSPVSTCHQDVGAAVFAIKGIRFTRHCLRLRGIYTLPLSPRILSRGAVPVYGFLGF
ncbi:MAG: hypothetical protein Q9187_005049, partial [Circinaria calcarea]